MYELKIFPFEIDGFQIDGEFKYINSSYIPRESEIIEKVRIIIESEDDEVNNYLLKVEVKSVHYELFKDNSSMPIVYGTVIGIDKEV